MKKEQLNIGRMPSHFMIKSTNVDTVSNVLAILDGNEEINGIALQVKLNDQENDGVLQNTFLAYVEDYK